jgi:hypothetical protein
MACATRICAHHAIYSVSLTLPFEYPYGLVKLILIVVYKHYYIVFKSGFQQTEGNDMNYIITDQLNPNAVNSRYGRPSSDCGEDVKCFTFVADNDTKAFEVFDDAVESGTAGYSTSNTQRVRPKLWRTKSFYKGGKPLFG